MFHRRHNRRAEEFTRDLATLRARRDAVAAYMADRRWEATAEEFERREADGDDNDREFDRRREDR